MALCARVASMPKVRALTAQQAKKTLAHRLGPRVDRLRQIATNLGVRNYRVFLTWTKFSGEERGEGEETLYKRVELLPTPKVTNIDAIAASSTSVGSLPIGSIRVDKVSVTYTEDQLAGRKSGDDHIPDDLTFFYEIVEDGRGDNPGYRHKYRLLSPPFRQPGRVGWTLVLERIGGGDMDRDGQPSEPDCLWLKSIPSPMPPQSCRH